VTSYHHSFRVPFDQLDPGGVLFFGHLFGHAHRAYEALLREIGFGLAALLEAGETALPLVHAEADYHHPMKLDDLIEVELEARAIGERSFTLGYRFWKGEVLCASATTVHVAVETGSGRPLPLPDPLRRGLAAYLADA